MENNNPPEPNYKFLNWILEHWGKLAICGIVICILIPIIVNHKPPPPFKHKWSQGDILCMKISGQRVQVTEAYTSNPGTTIRIASTETTTVDGGITVTAQSYPVIYVNDFELEECDK